MERGHFDLRGYAARHSCCPWGLCVCLWLRNAAYDPREADVSGSETGSNRLTRNPTTNVAALPSAMYQVKDTRLNRQRNMFSRNPTNIPAVAPGSEARLSRTPSKNTPFNDPEAT